MILYYATLAVMILGSGAFIAWAAPRVVREEIERVRASRPLPPQEPPPPLPQRVPGDDLLAFWEAQFDTEGSAP